MSETLPNAAQVAYWNDGAAPGWIEMQALLDAQIEPVGRAAIEALGLRAGESVIDVGCGCGQTTLTLAERVGASGRVLGVDVSAPMLEVARARAAGLPQAQLLLADAQTYAFEPGAFDAIHSRFGVMFFEDPTAAFANLKAGLKPGGRLAFVCWRAMDRNPIMTLPLAAARRHLPPPAPPTPGAPGPFAFADGERIRGILQAAGFAEIAVTPQDMPAGGYSLDDALRVSLRIGPLGAMLRENPGARDAVIQDVRAALASHVKDGLVFLDSATWIVTARRP